jgi:hypothetical protein
VIVLRPGFRDGGRYPRRIATPSGNLLVTPASSITEPGWLGAQLAATAARYRLDRPASVGVLWWYSASSVLLGPPVSSVVSAGPPADPALSSVVLYVNPDGRVLGARSTAVVPLPLLGSRLREALSTAVAAVASASGAPRPALWAIATDALANQVLWAGGEPGVAEELAASVGRPLPAPRYVSLGGTRFVRRGSCCLIYRSPGQHKCASCPRQHPDDRLRRLLATVGHAG